MCISHIASFVKPLYRVMNFEQALGFRLRQEVAVRKGLEDRRALRAGSGLIWLRDGIQPGAYAA
jgi:hypothetical protein